MEERHAAVTDVRFLKTHARGQYGAISDERSLLQGHTLWPRCGARGTQKEADSIYWVRQWCSMYFLALGVLKHSRTAIAHNDSLVNLCLSTGSVCFKGLFNAGAVNPIKQQKVIGLELIQCIEGIGL
jgi:hypothetical protein